MGKRVDYDKVTLIYESENVARRQNQRLLLQLVMVFLIACSFFTLLFVIYWMQATNPLDLENQATCKPAKFDYLMLTLLWPVTFCQFDICSSVPDKWEIHGLWPNYNDGGYPAFCCPEDKFDIKKVASLVDEMDKEWFSMNRDNNTYWFWEHEWSKHGTCCNSDEKLNDEFKYFNNTLALFNQYPIQQWLAQANILPNTTTSYSLKKFKSVIETNFGKKVIIQCMNHGKYKKKHSLLYAIKFCFDKELQPIDCPEGHQGVKCDKNVFYPQYKQDFAHTPLPYEVVTNSNFSQTTPK